MSAKTIKLPKGMKIHAVDGQVYGGDKEIPTELVPKPVLDKIKKAEKSATTETSKAE